MKRREFISKTIRSTAVISTTALSAKRIIGANDRVRIGLVGCGGRGRDVAELMRAVPGAEYNTVCDVYEPNAAAAKEWAGPSTRAYQDFRKLLEQKDVDAVHIATPDHWHAIITVLACQAGKDVYVEKPLAHNIREGRAMVTAARRHNRIVQAGTQHRSAPHYREVQRIIESGELGEVRFVRVWNYSNLTPYGIGHAPEAAPPAGLDWDLYLGPAPKVPYRKTRFMRSFRWFWDYAGGTITDFGTHRFDTVHQIMGVDAPKTVVATGGRFVVKDDGEMPDLLQVTYEYPNFVLSYEACNFNAHGMGGRTPGMNYYSMRDKDDRPHGEAFYGTNGALFSDRIGFEIYPERKAIARKDGSQDAKTQVEGYRMEGKRVQSKDATGLHVANFIECVRSRKLPAGDIEIGHRSTIIPHLGNIAYKTGKKLTWDAAREDFVGEPEASKLLGRKARKPWDLI
ncbi:MAG TPA: Gfo/Idh/MocA family oxidoreductase [Blastocatellia bacterium]|nr:Gfo/Idh/MocA family oxidoreductase [Blastocatellia bacterium]